MKKYHPLILLGISVISGILAVFVANRWLNNRLPDGPTAIAMESKPLTKIVIAAQDIGVGLSLSESNLALVEWPKANVPKGAFKNVSEVAGRVAVTPLSSGTPVLAAELAAPGSGAGLVALIPPGERAMSIKVDEVIGVAGFIIPNSYVDVIGVDTGIKSRTNPKAKTILEKIRVLAIAQETFTDEGKAKVVRTVTLQVKPNEAEKLALQTHEGNVHLVLRNPLEEKQPEVEPTPEPRKIASLKPREYKPKPAPYQVEILRGSKRENIHFRTNESEERM